MRYQQGSQFTLTKNGNTVNSGPWKLKPSVNNNNKWKQRPADIYRSFMASSWPAMTGLCFTIATKMDVTIFFNASNDVVARIFSKASRIQNKNLSVYLA